MRREPGQPFLGVSTVPTDLARQQSGGVARGPPGLAVTEVEAGSPAARAGLAVGDVLTSYSGQALVSRGQLSRLVRQTPGTGPVPRVGWTDASGTARQAAVAVSPRGQP